MTLTQTVVRSEAARAIKAEDTTGSVIYMGTVSKTMAPGLRIGWVVGPEAVVQRLGDVKMQTDYGASSVSQWIMTELLESGDYDLYLDDLRRELRARRDNALSALEKYFRGMASWNCPSGDFTSGSGSTAEFPWTRCFQSA